MLKSGVDRRLFLAGMGSVAMAGLAGCSQTRSKTVSVVDTQQAQLLAARRAEAALLYAARPEEQFPLPAIPVEKLDPKFYRQMVSNPTGEPPGTLVVDTGNHFLYFTYPNGQAMRYGVGLGRAGFAWAGRGKIQYKRQWPRWTPPDEMIARQPELAPYSAANGGMPPGLDNALGARALYIFQNKQDTLYRIHGSPEWWTIGKSVSSGCVRMINQDVIDLYDRVPDGTQILVTDLSRPGVENVNDVRDQQIYEPNSPNQNVSSDNVDLSADASQIQPVRRRYLDDNPSLNGGYSDSYDPQGY